LAQAGTTLSMPLCLAAAPRPTAAMAVPAVVASAAKAGEGDDAWADATRDSAAAAGGTVLEFDINLDPVDAAGAGAPRPRGGCFQPARPPREVPEGLRRYTVLQKSVHPRAVREIRNGRKESCWMWFVLPTPPFVVGGVERGSARNRAYALRSDAEARAYLQFEADGVSLRRNYVEMMCAVREQLSAGRKPLTLFGHIDEPKLRSSARLFERITRGNGREGDDEGSLPQPPPGSAPAVAAAAAGGRQPGGGNDGRAAELDEVAVEGAAGGAATAAVVARPPSLPSPRRDDGGGDREIHEVVVEVLRLLGEEPD